MLSTGTIRAVNPVSLAEVSGVTKVPGFASSPVAPVVRPDLLTAQLSGCHPQCEHCAGTHSGPVGATGFASYIPPDYGTLRGLAADGEYGLFKMWSSQSSLPAGPGGGGIPGGTGTSSLAGMGKGGVGTNPASMYATRNWSYGLRGMGKGGVGTNPASMYATRNWSYGLRGMGQALTGGVLSAAGSGQATLPGIGNLDPGTQGILQKIVNALNIFHKGSSEANTIVPQQNALMAYLGNITNQILTGQNPSLAQLQNLYTQTWILFTGFIEFVLKPVFTDRRASGQALNTVMPYCDGSCGYAVPLGATASPTQQNCMNWGAGSIGGDGTTGMLGAIGRAIVAAGGSVPITQSPVQAANSGIAPSTAAMTAAAQTAAVTGGFAPFQASLISAGLPATVAGIPTSTLILIALGVFLMSRMGGK